MPSLLLLTLPSFFGLALAQGVGNWLREVHPKLQWSSCAAEGDCQKIDAEIVGDANWRWLHNDNGYLDCYSYNDWVHGTCNSTEDCTAKCVYDGIDYGKVLGIQTANDSVSLKLQTRFDFSYSVGSRTFLMENRTMYKTFTLLNNELAFDVDLSTVECGINSALYFVAMDADGGVSRYPGNTAGAEYGVGYCDASCPRSARFIGGKANYNWLPSETDQFSGTGDYAACCAEFDVWNSNAHSYSMAAKTCPPGKSQFHVCEGGRDCDPHWDSGGRRVGSCDPDGCSWSAYRTASKEFYGKGKVVDTNKMFTVVTRFEESRVYQFFIQDGKKIDVPLPRWEGLPKEAGISAEMCEKQTILFNERDRLSENGGWSSYLEYISRPMVLTMSINVDHRAYNLWLDGSYPLGGDAAEPDLYERGPCRPWEDNEPAVVQSNNPRAKVTWSNIRFGPIGSTVKV